MKTRSAEVKLPSGRSTAISVHSSCRPMPRLAAMSRRAPINSRSRRIVVHRPPSLIENVSRRELWASLCTPIAGSEFLLAVYTRLAWAVRQSAWRGSGPEGARGPCKEPFFPSYPALRGGRNNLIRLYATVWGPRSHRAAAPQPRGGAPTAQAGMLGGQARKAPARKTGQEWRIARDVVEAPEVGGTARRGRHRHEGRRRGGRTVSEPAHQAGCAKHARRS